MTRGLAGGLAAALTLALAPAGAARAATGEFSAHTARVLPHGRLEAGVFSPLRLGVRDRVDVALHPGWFLVAPNAQVKVAWGSRGPLSLASTHGLLYPTPLMRLLSREGTGGIVPADVRYPHLLASANHLLATAALGGHLLTLRAGGRVARNLTPFDGPELWSQVEWHLVWPRAAAWFTGWSADVGLAAEGPLRGRLGYRVALERFFMPGLRGDWAYEWSGILSYRPSRRVLVRGGLLWSWAELPYGTRLSVPFPLLDVAWAWELRRSGRSEAPPPPSVTAPP